MKCGGSFGRFLDINDIVEGFKAGAVDYVTKPFNAQELLARINTHIKLKRARDNVVNMLNIMSHDIRSPLNCFIGLAEILANNEEGNLTQEQIEHAQTIYKSGGNLLEIINDILELSKIGSSHHSKIKKTIINGSDLIENSISIFKNESSLKDIKINTKIKSDSYEIYGNLHILTRILINIISNAIKFTKRGGTIDVIFHKTNNNSIFEISDNGVGISQDKLDILFDKFNEKSTPGTEEEKGTGFEKVN